MPHQNVDVRLVSIFNIRHTTIDVLHYAHLSLLDRKVELVQDRLARAGWVCKTDIIKLELSLILE